MQGLRGYLAGHSSYHASDLIDFPALTRMLLLVIRIWPPGLPALLLLSALGPLLVLALLHEGQLLIWRRFLRDEVDHVVNVLVLIEVALLPAGGSRLLLLYWIAP